MNSDLPEGWSAAAGAKQSTANWQKVPDGTAMLCLRCHELATPKKKTKGSLVTELLLWLLVLPGALYSIWRLTTRAQVCRHCGCEELIPPHTDRARQIMMQR